MKIDPDEAVRELKFRNPAAAAALSRTIARTVAAIGRPRVTLMHVCGSHEQAIARFGLRATFPAALDLVMGPGCPVCVTDQTEIDDAVALAGRGVRVATYGDMLRVPGTSRSLADARADGHAVHVVYGIGDALELARRDPSPIVFFASGFETTAAATAAALVTGTPDNFFVLSAHRYIPPAMEVVASIPGSRVEGFLAAGHAATITGWGVFEPLAARTRLPVVVAGFEPLDVLAAIATLLVAVHDGRSDVQNAFPRCVTRGGNQRALDQLWRVFEPSAGRWRGIADVPGGSLALRREWAHVDARQKFDLEDVQPVPASAVARQCQCGDILSGLASPADCALFGRECVPDAPMGACMVSTEGTCRIAYEYGGRHDLSAIGRAAAEHP